jgi:hypothetical protein
VKALAINDKVLKFGISALAFTPSFVSADSSGVGSDCATSSGGIDQIQNPANAGASCSQANGTTGNLFAQGGIFHTIADTLIYIVGAIAVIMLIIGGLRYVISQGSKEGVASAKDTILYAVIGIVVAILAYAIVNFVTGSLVPASSTGTS